MRTTIFFLVCFILCVFTVLSCNDFPNAKRESSTPQSSPPSGALGRELERIRAKHSLPGLAAAVVRGGQVEEKKVTGVRRLGAPDRIWLDDRFHLASCTKSMTATLAAILVSKGRLQWTTKLMDVLPELRERARAEYINVTLELLLAHAAQMPAYTQFGRNRLEELKNLQGSPTEQRIKFLMEVLTSEEPNNGTGDAAYSNVGYTAAAAMLERVSEESWEDLIREQLAKPLGMTSLGFGWPATMQTPAQPRGHFTRDKRLVEQPLQDSYMLPVALWPAGAVHTSIGDLARYAADHLNGLCGRSALLPAAAYQRLHRTLTGEASGFTLGWGVREDSRWGRVHYGAGSGGTFFVRITIVPTLDTAIVVASNSGEAAVATKEVIESILGSIPSSH